MSQADSQEHTIDDHSYTMYMWDPFIANKWTVYLAGIIGPTIGDFAGAVAGAESGATASDLFGAKLEPLLVSSGVGGLFTRIDHKKLEELAIALGAQCNLHLDGGKHVQMDSAQIKLHFKGRPGAMYSWIRWGVSVQLQDFTSALAPLWEKIRLGLAAKGAEAEKKAESPTPSEETDSSGD